MSTAALTLAAATGFDDYSPSLVVAAVNELVGVSREAAVERIGAAAADVPPPPDCTGLLWVMRVLFDLAPGVEFPPVPLGSPSVPPPSDRRALPRFPIDVFRDVPFLVVRGYALAGLPQGLEDHIAFYAKFGVQRAAALSPAPGDEHLEREFLSHWVAAYGDERAPDIADVIKAQMARLA